uniref:Vesicle transport protein n=1 Tax=Cyclophora tenuis TaxID=216820 RepID=A0A7S1GM62_CYCTE
MGMNYQQRFQMFCTLLFLSALFFALGFFVGLPTIALRPQKFAICFTFGSLTFMASFGILKGPWAHLRGMLSADRLPFTTIYIASMLLTLYFTFQFGGASGYLLVMASSALQLLALLWYLISFLPGGSAGLSIVLRAMCRILQPVFVLCAKLHATVMGYCFTYLTSSSSNSS